MKQWNTRVLGAVILVAALASSLYATAQGARRPPTAEERAVVERYKEVVLKVLQPVANPDWEEDSSGDYDIPDDFLVTPRPDVPFEITGSIQRSYHVPTGSPYSLRFLAFVTGVGPELCWFFVSESRLLVLLPNRPGRCD